MTISFPPSLPTPPAPAGTGQVAQAPQSASQGLPQIATPIAPPDPVAALQSAIALTRQTSIAKQDGMAPLLANALAAARAGLLPPPVQAAVQQLVSLALPTNKAPSADDIKTALAQSGLFTESGLAKQGEAPRDQKSALGKLAEAARQWAAQSGESEIPSGGASVPPPGRHPVAQGPASPSLPAGSSPVDAAKLLITGSEAALARQNLLQLASLPEDADPQSRGTRTPDPRYVVDLPLMTPQGPAVAQLIIQRDSSGRSAEHPEPVWRVGLALTIEPLGPVRANLALSGDHAWITIAADRPDALTELKQGAGWLNDALSGSHLEADIAFVSAAPAKSSAYGTSGGSAGGTLGAYGKSTV
ncbi:hypothetical protein FHS83_002820 [Rhizomicrobium palustre]|uniref:Flagellar hook-length control protein-like C-terminal domain-containing protein n=1 Tax=Rhizomicrobium palustre TaxID=189966 RepID=A0A846N2Q2_9PROT|nr:hypothetical protein [Rhizomicrobium palustre]